MAETLSMISKISFVAAAICLVVTILFFARFKIPSVIGDLSGRSARKSMEQMREINQKSGNKTYRPGRVNLERGILTETMHGERRGNGETEVLLDENDTVVLDDCQKRIHQDVKGIPIEILEEVVLVHTREEIP